MPYNPDKAYQAAQVYAARAIVKDINAELEVLQEARFFVDIDTMRDIVDPQGAAACVHYLLDQDIPADLMQDPNVVGLIDEFELMQDIPAARHAVQTLFESKRFCDLLHDAIQALQEEFGAVAGETPDILREYFAGDVIVQEAQPPTKD